MNEQNHPAGAIKTLAEIECLLARKNSGEKAVIWPVAAGAGTPAVEDLTPCTITGLAQDRYLSVAVPSKRSATIDLAWRNIGTNGGTAGGYLFTNFWHAYAYSLKIPKNKRA